MSVLPPADWKKSVCEILEAQNSSKITWTVQAQNDWDANTLSWRNDAYDAIRLALAAGTEMKHVEMETGTTYSFWFNYKSVRFYGKICLRNCRTKIKIISTHIPNKGNEL